MRRSLLTVAAALLALGAVFYAAQRLTSQLCCARLAQPADELDWLRREFGLADRELATIRKLHAGYLPKCQEYCDRIAKAKLELKGLLDSGPQISEAVEQKLAEIAKLRAQCQANMLRHFAEVSQAMPPEQGRRYLAAMQQLTLGFHEQVEQSMSSVPGTTHGHK